MSFTIMCVYRELKSKFNVEEIPTVVVLRPDGSVLSPNAVPEICNCGPDCFQNWKEGAELMDRNFMMAEEFDDTKMRSMTDPLRRLKYKVDKKKKKKMESREEEHDDEEEEEQNDSEEEEEEGNSCWYVNSKYQK